MSRDGNSGGGERPVVYCLVPRDLATKLHEPLRRHFRDDPAVQVVVEQRASERRAEKERRVRVEARAHDRRRIRGAPGRRVSERRAAAVIVEGAPLPRKLRHHVDRLAFFERLEPTGLRTEDADTDRLVTRIQAGEVEHFATLYTRYFDRVYGYLRTVFNDAHEAEDLTQQVFVRVLESLSGYERRQSFRFWLFSIVRNRAIDELRRRSRLSVEGPGDLDRRRERDEVLDDELPALNWISDRELVLFLERLPEPQRQVIVLKFMIGLDTREIAELMGRATTDVRKLQHRGLAFLRDRLSALGRTPRYERRRGIRAQPRRARVLRGRRFSLSA